MLKNLNYYLLTLVSSLRGITRNPNLEKFPPVLAKGNYRYSHPLSYKGKKYTLAIYKNRYGEEFVAKMWYGQEKDIRYHYLINEINTYRLMDLAVFPRSEKYQKIASQVTFPKLKYELQSQDKVILLVTKVKGKPLRDYPITKKIRVLLKVLAKMETLSVGLGRIRANTGLQIISSWYFLLTLPLLSLVALVKHTSLAKKILSGLWQSVTCVTKVCNTSKMGLVHRDLNSSNILVTKSKIVVLDLQLCAWSLFSHDFGNMFYRLWSDRDVSEMTNLLKLYLTKHKRRKGEYLFMLIYSALFDLAFGTGKTEAESKQYLNYLLHNLALFTVN